MKSLVANFIFHEDGQGLTEYGLVLGVLSIAAFGTILLLTDELKQMYSRVLEVVQTRNS